MQKIVDSWFLNNGEFLLKRGNVKGLKIYNSTLEKCATKGIEIHYELQKIKKSNTFTIRLDCHIFPYDTILKEEGKYDEEKAHKYYSDKIANKIVALKKDLFAKLEVNYKILAEKEIKYNNYSDKAWCVAEREIKDVSTEEGILSNVYDFIAKTYPDLIRVLKELEII